jgi:hypothetical protein
LGSQSSAKFNLEEKLKTTLLDNRKLKKVLISIQKAIIGKLHQILRPLTVTNYRIDVFIFE